MYTVRHTDVHLLLGEPTDSPAGFKGGATSKGKGREGRGGKEIVPPLSEVQNTSVCAVYQRSARAISYGRIAASRQSTSQPPGTQRPASLHVLVMRFIQSFHLIKDFFIAI